MEMKFSHVSNLFWWKLLFWALYFMNYTLFIEKFALKLLIQLKDILLAYMVSILMFPEARKRVNA